MQKTPGFRVDVGRFLIALFAVCVFFLFLFLSIFNLSFQAMDPGLSPPSSSSLPHPDSPLGVEEEALARALGDEKLLTMEKRGRRRRARYGGSNLRRDEEAKQGGEKKEEKKEGGERKEGGEKREGVVGEGEGNGKEEQSIEGENGKQEGENKIEQGENGEEKGNEEGQDDEEVLELFLASSLTSVMSQSELEKKNRERNTENESQSSKRVRRMSKVLANSVTKKPPSSSSISSSTSSSSSSSSSSSTASTSSFLSTSFSPSSSSSPSSPTELASTPCFPSTPPATSSAPLSFQTRRRSKSKGEAPSSSSPLAEGELRRKGKTSFDKMGGNNSERGYLRLVALAHEEEFDDLDSLNFLYHSGKDSLNRAIIVLVGCLVPAHKIDMARLILYLVYKLDPIVNDPFVLVVCNSEVTSENRPNFNALKMMYQIFTRKYKKNVQKVFIVHPTTTTRLLFRAFRPFVKTKFWKKLHYIDDINDLFSDLTFKHRKLVLPDCVIKFKLPPQKMFGCLLEEVMGNGSDMALPCVVEDIVVALLCSDATEKVGIFRINGGSQQVAELKRRYDEGEKKFDLSCYDTYCLASTLKQFFRDLPEPIFTYELHNQFLKNTPLHKSNFTKWRRRTLKTINALPSANQMVLHFLFLLLHKISEKSEVNMMDAPNLAIVFAPNLMRSPSLDPMVAISESPMINQCIKTLISDCFYLFLTNKNVSLVENTDDNRAEEKGKGKEKEEEEKGKEKEEEEKGKEGEE